MSGTKTKQDQPKIKVVQRIILPRRDGGSDWGTERFLLARRGKIELFWWKAHKAWQDRLIGYQPEPASLSLQLPQAGVNFTYCITSTLHEGGRLSRKLLLQYADKINEAFGVKIADKLDPQKTLLIG